MQPSHWITGALALALSAAAGCQSPVLEAMTPASWASKLRLQSPDKDKADGAVDEFDTEVKTPMVGDYTTVAGLNLLTLRGVGLVTGLDGTGGDPPPSVFRTALMEDMRRRGVRNPNTILRSPDTALVVVRAYLPPLINEGEKFDVDVRLPGGSEATSLKGGWLMKCRLSEQAIVPGRGLLKGNPYAKAQGPILVAAGAEGDSGSRASLLKRGRILGGGVSLESRDMALFLRNDFRSVRNSHRIASRIGQRFHQYDEYGLKEPLAEAVTDRKIELKILRRYKENFPRFLQVVRNIAFRETAVARRVRMKKLRKRLRDPAQAKRAALELEAIGTDAKPILKEALDDPRLEIRFHAATALAYLGDTSGLEVLAEAARREPAFRVFALAAMSTLDVAESHLLLRRLMGGRGENLLTLDEDRDEPREPITSAETRYGAFRALTTMDPNDPFVRGRSLGDGYKLHVLDTIGPPMVHVTYRRKAEIVLFGKDQRFETPLVLRAGRNILVTAAAGEDRATVTRYKVGRPEERKKVSTRVADVIEAVASFDGSYPDVTQMLVQADKQHNLPGSLQIDELPEAGRVYVRKEDRPQQKQQSEADSQTRVGHRRMTPNLFDHGGDPDEDGESDEEESGDRGTASLVDVSEISGEDRFLENEPAKWYEPSRLFGGLKKAVPWNKD